MGPFGRRAVTYDDVTYASGGRYRVIGEGAVLAGRVPELGGYSSWRQQLRTGDLLTCTGDGPGFGGDPGYGVEFTSPESEAAGAFHCNVRPTAVACSAPGLQQACSSLRARRWMMRSLARADMRSPGKS